MKPDHEDPRLTAYALGELPEDERAELEARLEASPEARQEVEETRDWARFLTEALAQEAAAAQDPEWAAKVRQALETAPAAPEPPIAPDPQEVRPPSTVSVPSWRFGWWTWLGAAAAVLVACAGAWWLGADRSVNPTKRLAAVDSAIREETPPPVHPTAAKPVETTPIPPPAPEPMLTSPALPLPSSLPAAPAEASAAEKSEAGPSRSAAPKYVVRAAPQARPVPGPTSHPAPMSARPAGAVEPALRSRYGLAPGPSSTAAAAGGPAGAARGAQPEMMKRYGLMPSPGGANPAAGSSFASAEVEFETRRGLVPVLPPGPDRRWDERPSADSNPGYLDTGDNAFESPLRQPLSTFSLDVDTGSYANVRRFLKAGQFPPRAAVRIEEMINYFPYRPPAPQGEDVFGVSIEVARCPWEARHRLVRVALKARDLAGERPPGNLVFLVDVSGSMQPAERLPLLKNALRATVRRLSPADRVAIVTYASGAAVRLESTSCEEKDRILEAIDALEAGGSTNGEGGIRQAYEVARRGFISGGVNRVLLCTDGDFNVGISDQNELVRMIEDQARSGVFLTTLGVGTDNFKDALMRRLADRGNGSYHYLDSYEEGQRVLLDQMNATFVTVARDAKAQVEFNPARVAAWRLIGYEKRLMAAQDFNDDTKDAGEVGAGQTVTVLYEVVPAGERVPGSVAPLKYQPAPAEDRPARTTTPASPELLTFKLRYQRPEGSSSVLKEVPVMDRERELRGDFQFAAAVAAFGLALRDPGWDGGHGFDTALELARSSVGEDPGGWRAEFLTLVRKARGLPRR